jgi:hypothetical protein
VSFSSKEILLTPQDSKNREGRILPITSILVILMQQRIENTIEELLDVLHGRGRFYQGLQKSLVYRNKAGWMCREGTSRLEKVKYS